MGYNWIPSPALSTTSTTSFISSPTSFIDSPTGSIPPPPATNRKKYFVIVFSFVVIVLLLASAVSAAVLVARRRTASSDGSDGEIQRRPASSIERTCSRTTYPKLCVNSLVNFPGAAAADERDLLPMSINATLRSFHQAMYGASAIEGQPMHPLTRSAYDACVELTQTSAVQLSDSLAALSSKNANPDDVLTWLSAAATNQDTCEEGLADVEAGPTKEEIWREFRNLGELVSNCLAIFSANKEYFEGMPVQDREMRGRRLMGMEKKMGFPAWVRRGDRRLMMTAGSELKADFVVSIDGKNCTHTTIEAAIKAVPESSSRRFIIYVRAGRYDETLKVGRKKTNIMMVGDGKGQTIIAGSKNIFENLTTFHTASFAATGTGFVAKDITFQNWAGPEKHQAVALRVGADHAVIFRCSIIGYQDTLYVHSQRQFFRECDVYGTVDFIFGNAAVVFQNCSLYARKPMALQKNTITAQNRKDPNMNTGISIHNCRILATPDLAAAKSSYQTYLGRPWKLYSRVVYLLSYMDDHVNPAGWLPWNTSDFALDTLYYGEYMNYGPGGAVGMRVKWPGYRVITVTEEASKFTVAQFIYGSSWIPSTGVQFTAGLTL